MNEEKEALKNSTSDFEQLISSAAPPIYVLRLYVSGMTPRSTEAINNLTRICEKYLKDRYQLEVIDIYKNPELAQADQIIAAPTLVKKLPLPLRNLVGTLSDEERVLVGLNLIEKK